MVAIAKIKSSFPRRKKDSSKADFGHVLVVAGSQGYIGAAYLTSQAAVRSGSGLVTLAAGKSIYPVLARKLTEVMVRPYPETEQCSLSLKCEKPILKFAGRCNSVAIGPGLSRNVQTARLVRALVKKLNKTVVLDADGINAFCGHRDDLKKCRSSLILTPHEGEFSRLTGISKTGIKKARKDIALEFAARYNIVLVLKGHNTVVASPDGKLYVNKTGNPGMASGGVGDVLTGMIAAFVAQGLDRFKAAALGVYFHGLAGDLAAKEMGYLSLIATDLLYKLPVVLKKLG